MNDPSKLIESATKLLEETLKFLLGDDNQQPTKPTE